MDSKIPSMVGYNMGDYSSSNYGRRPNFSNQELNALVAGVEKHRDVILPRDGPILVGTHAANSTSRSDAWKDIAEMVNTVSESERGLQEVIKRWRYLKSRTKVKARRLTQWDKPLNDIQLRVMNVVGEDETTGNESIDDSWEMDGVEYDVSISEAGDEYAHSENNDVAQDYTTTKREKSETNNSNTPDQNIISVSSVIPSDPEVIQTNEVPSQASLSEKSISRKEPRNGRSRQKLVTSSSPAFQVSNGTRHIFPISEYDRAATTQRYRYTSYEDALQQALVEPDIVQGEPRKRQKTKEAPLENTVIPTDKNNVNITVKSCCGCSQGANGKENGKLVIAQEKLEIERQRFELEKERFKVERERLDIEKEMLAVEKERLAVEKERLAIKLQETHT